VRAGTDRRRSDKDCDYKATHDFLRRFGKRFANIIAEQRLWTRTGSVGVRLFRERAGTARRRQSHDQGRGAPDCGKHCEAAGAAETATVLIVSLPTQNSAPVILAEEEVSDVSLR
jgi:hypothetical protein